MGHKVNPYGFRLGVIYPWKSNWYAGRREYAGQLHEDIWIRKHIRSRLSRAGISSIDIERKGDQIWVFIRTARPGIVIGRKGAEVDRLRKDIERYTKKRVDVKVEDMNQAASESRPETDATLLAQGVAEQLAGRVAFRRAMRRAVQTAMRSGALGVRVATGGRLGGSEMGRREWYREGRVPLHTLRAKVDFGTAEAKTTFGIIGVKVWVYHGDEVPHREQQTERALARAHASRAAGRHGGARRGCRRRASRAGACAVPRPQRRPRRARAGRAPTRRDAAPDAAEPEPTPAAPRRRATAERRPRATEGGESLMLAPKKVKHRKVHRGHRRGMAKGGTEIHFGDYGLVALEPAWITNRQIEAARVAITRHIRRGGQGVDQHLPRQVGDQEAGRDPHGLGQGQPRGLGRRREARPRDVRAGRGAGVARALGHEAGPAQAADQDQVHQPGRGVGDAEQGR